MKFQVVTIKPKKSGINNGFTIKRELFDGCGLIDTAYCNIDVFHLGGGGFIASGFSSIYAPTLSHDRDNTDESIEDFIKAVFAK